MSINILCGVSMTGDGDEKCRDVFYSVLLKSYILSGQSHLIEGIATG